MDDALPLATPSEVAVALCGFETQDDFDEHAVEYQVERCLAGQEAWTPEEQAAARAE